MEEDEKGSEKNLERKTKEEMALNYRTVVVKTSTGEVVEVSMTLQNYGTLKEDRSRGTPGYGTYDTTELSAAQNEKLRCFIEELIVERRQPPTPLELATDWIIVRPSMSPFQAEPAKRHLQKVHLPEERPETCQYGGEGYCNRLPKKNQIYCGHHLRKAAKKHSDRKTLKRSRSSHSNSGGEDDEEQVPNYDELFKEGPSPVKKSTRIPTSMNQQASAMEADIDSLMQTWIHDDAD